MRNSRAEKVWGVDYTLPPVKKDLPPPWCIVERSRIRDLDSVNVRSFARYVTIDATAF